VTQTAAPCESRSSSTKPPGRELARRRDEGAVVIAAAAPPPLRTRPNRLGAVYRCFDKDGALLYIGVTDSPGARHGSHRREKKWWSEVDEVEWTFYSTYGPALDAETDAIETEAPRYNAGGAE
jgi:predicted GIY-YIG superfamily endonuclease